MILTEFLMEEIQMDNEYLKKYLMSLAIRGIQIKSSFQFTLVK